MVSKNEVVESDFKALLSSIQSSRVLLVQMFKNSFETVIKDLTLREIENMDGFSNKKFKEQDKKMSEKNNYLEKQMNSFEKVMDFLFDSVNKDQLTIYEQFITEHFGFFKEQLDYRKAFIQKFESLTNSRPELLTYVMNYYAGDSSVHTIDQQKKSDDFSRDLYKMILKVWNASTAKQKEKLKENMTDLRAELTDMTKS